MGAAQHAAHEELNQMRKARQAAAMEAAAREAERERATRDGMHRAASALRQERRVRSRLAQADLAGEAPRHDDEAGQGRV